MTRVRPDPLKFESSNACDLKKAQDVPFNVVSHIAGKLDLSQIFMMGHSFGGSTALLAASKDDRLRGCIALDPWMFPVAEEHFQLTKPVLVINTELFVNAANVGKVREVAQGACAAVLEGAVHLVHTDAPLLFRSNLLKGALGRFFKINYRPYLRFMYFRL
jgi:dienelactone hydrolase